MREAQNTFDGSAPSGCGCWVIAVGTDLLVKYSQILNLLGIYIVFRSSFLDGLPDKE